MPPPPLALPAVAETALARQRTADVLADLARTVTGEYGRVWGGYGVPTWDEWEFTFAGMREHVEGIVAGAADPGEALFRDADVVRVAHQVAHERCCEEASEHADDAYGDLVGALHLAFGFDEQGLPGTDAHARRPEWLEEGRWVQVVAAYAVEKAKEGRCRSLDEWVGTECEEDVTDEGARRHQAECPRGSVTGPGGMFHSW